MAASGFVKIHRRLQHHWLWNQKPFSEGQAWLDLILLASHADTRFKHGAHFVDLKRGQFLSSMEIMGFRWGWGRKKTRSYVESLITEGMIIKESTNRYTVFTITQYDYWQSEIGPARGRQRAGGETKKGTAETVETKTIQASQGRLENISGTAAGLKKEHIQEEQERQERKEEKDHLVVRLYNQTCVSLPKVHHLTDKRRKAISARWKEYGNTLEPFRKLFEKAEASRFLKGQKENSTWLGANFDWLLKPDNMAKTLEGYYSDERSHPHGRSDNHNPQPDQYADLNIRLSDLYL